MDCVGCGPVRLSRMAIAWARSPKPGGPSCANSTARGPLPNTEVSRRKKENTKDWISTVAIDGSLRGAPGNVEPLGGDVARFFFEANVRL